VSNQYEFVSHWRVDGTCGEVADILADPLAFVRWWPSVYLDVVELRPPDARGLGRRVRFHTKGWLPYTDSLGIGDRRIALSARLHDRGERRVRRTRRLELRAGWTRRRSDVRLAARAEKPLLRNLSFLLKPLFEANHRWAMAQGEESLKLELLRRRASSDAARVRVPPPPGPVTYAGVALLAGAAAIGAGLAYLIIRARRRSR
jgi:hypothetical protein